MSDLIVLSPTEIRVLDHFLWTGRSDRDLAADMEMGYGTVREHMAALRRKFGVHSKSQLMALGWGIGWQGREAC